jgi:hypothetical protein
VQVAKHVFFVERSSTIESPLQIWKLLHHYYFSVRHTKNNIVSICLTM